MISNQGENDKRFSQDVDNYLNIGDIQNALIGVLTDSNGHIKGVLQLFNKIDPNINVNTTPQITEEDKEEVA
jgi:hypothetical protein